jgi:NADH:ubiquinone oxidoreductase subunit 6 (subunit J)
MPHGWEIGLFIHIIDVFALGGAVFVSFATFSMMRRAKTVQEVRVWARLGRVLSQYYVLPACAVVLILSGAYQRQRQREVARQG